MCVLRRMLNIIFTFISVIFIHNDVGREKKVIEQANTEQTLLCSQLILFDF